MQQATYATFVARLLDRERLAFTADVLAVALAVSLPWSTSGTGILAVLWLIVLLPTLDLTTMRRIVLSPAGGLPILFVLLALLGTAWSPAPLGDRFVSVVPFARMLAIPLLLYQFSRSPRGVWVIYGLLASCVALLLVSYWSYWTSKVIGQPAPTKPAGVPVKNYIAQSGFFTISAFVLIEIATERWSRQRRLAIGLLIVALAFLINIAMVATARTALLVIAALLVLYALRRSTWKTAAAMLTAGVVLAGLAWLSSDYLRQRVTGVFSEIREFQSEAKTTPSGQRLDLWGHSIKLIAQAPVIGYGTGSLSKTFREATSVNKSTVANADNPHNQTFTVAIQLGLLGVVVLYAMWLSHLWLFRGSGWVAWLGVVVVTQSVIGSLVNSYLFDFEAGWTYAVCVGVAGALALQRTRPAATPLGEPRTVV